MGESHLQQTVVRDAILLKAVEEGCWCVLHLRLFNDHHTLKVGVHTRGFCVGPNSNTGVVARPFPGDIDPAEALVEELIKTFMDVIRLSHHHCVSFNGRVTNGSNCVDLEWDNSSSTRSLNI